MMQRTAKRKVDLLRGFVAAVALLVAAGAALGQATAPMRSSAWGNVGIACNTGDQLMPLDGYGGDWRAPPAVAGAGPFPADTSVSVRKVCVTHVINGDATNSYAVVGHSGPNGDHISPWLHGSGTQCTDYPADAPVRFTAGEYFDVHTRCQSGNHWVLLQLWYTVP